MINELRAIEMQLPVELDTALTVIQPAIKAALHYAYWNEQGHPSDAEPTGYTGKTLNGITFNRIGSNQFRRVLNAQLPNTEAARLIMFGTPARKLDAAEKGAIRGWMVRKMGTRSERNFAAVIKQIEESGSRNKPLFIRSISPGGHGFAIIEQQIQRAVSLGVNKVIQRNGFS